MGKVVVVIRCQIWVTKRRVKLDYLILKIMKKDIEFQVQIVEKIQVLFEE